RYPIDTLSLHDALPISTRMPMAFLSRRRLKSGAVVRFLSQAFMQLLSDSKRRVLCLQRSVNPLLNEEAGRNDTSASPQGVCAKFARPGVRLSNYGMAFPNLNEAGHDAIKTADGCHMA